MNPRAASRRSGLQLLLVSIAVNTVLGVWALLAPDFGETHGKVLTTSFLVSAAMFGVLVNSAPSRHRVLWPLPVVAACSVASGFVLLIVVVWVSPDSDVVPKLAVSALVSGGGGTFIGLYQLVDARAVLAAWRRLNMFLVAVLCATALVALWVKVGAEWMLRLIGVESVLVAAMAVAIPVIARFQPPAVESSLRTRVVRFCPSCGASMPEQPINGAVAINCHHCDLHAVITSHPGGSTGTSPSA
jgi:hypothetical protein